MIITYPSYAMPVFLRLGNERSHCWKCVDLELNIPYFFVDFEKIVEEEAAIMRRIISSERELLQLCSEIMCDPSSQMHQLSIIAPGWLNQTNHWQMIDIVEIQRAHFHPNDTPITVFVNPIGQKLITSMQEINLQDATQIESIFSIR